MICDPLTYVEFGRKSCVLKYCLQGLFFCFLITCEKLGKVIALVILYRDPAQYYNPRSEPVVTFANYHEGTRIFSIVKFILLKVGYAVAIVYMAIKTKAALRQSSSMTQDNSDQKQDLHRRLFYFTLIPLGNNFFFFLPELLREIFPESRLVSYNIIPKPVETCLPASVVVVGSFAYFFGFPILFPKVREAMICQTTGI